MRQIKRYRTSIKLQRDARKEGASRKCNIRAEPGKESLNAQYDTGQLIRGSSRKKN